MAIKQSSLILSSEIRVLRVVTMNLVSHSSACNNIPKVIHLITRELIKWTVPWMQYT